ncbi:MAG TPA: hypothetical protein VFM46_06475 [Pseudomonadales bacterium]|nr:hypothetical protein [Pseudomonadales bacterium]
MMNAVQKHESVRPNNGNSARAKVSPYASAVRDSRGDDWSITQADAGDLQLLVAACLAAGDAVMFSCSRKGYAICTTVYHDGEPTKLWATSADDFAEIVGKVTRLALQQLPSEVAAKLTTE